MLRIAHLLLFLFLISLQLSAQEEANCSQLGVWLWHFEDTKQPSHANLARTISAMGGQRIYVKVADGGYNPISWPEILDADIISTYKAEHVEAWAWSYNYQGNVEAQGRALYEAAKTGYAGYVIDIEMEFDGEDTRLEELMQSFFISKQRAIADGYADQNFKLYVTTWGNPVLHNYRIDILDKYVDAYMPQTYIEEWGGDHLAFMEACIAEGNAEYASLGATKPIHHILSTAQQIVSAEDITAFFRLSGPETSLWRIPGAGISQLVWDRWKNADWDIDFCQTVSTHPIAPADLSLLPNPAGPYIALKLADDIPSGQVNIYTQHGSLVLQLPFTSAPLDIASLPAGMYHLIWLHDQGSTHRRFVKM